MKQKFAKFKQRKAGPKRHTHRTAAGLEDALAVLMDVARDLEALTIRVSQALAILRNVRAGPHAYNPNKPAGLRITIKSK